MKVLKILLSSVILVVLALTLLGNEESNDHMGAPTVTDTPRWPVVEAAGPAPETDVAEIKTLLHRNYEVQAIASTTFDITPFATVYINDPAVPLRADQAAFLEQVRGLQEQADPGLQHDGWLAFKTAKYLDLQRGVEAMKELTEQAQAEGRHVTADELKSIPGVVGIPAVPAAGRNTQLTFKEINVAGNQAEVIYDDGAALARAFFIRTAQGWRIAGIRDINIHF